MPTETVVTIIAAGGFENSPSNIVSRHDARDQALPVDRMLRRRHGGQNRGHDDGSGMVTPAGIVELEGMGGYTVD